MKAMTCSRCGSDQTEGRTERVNSAVCESCGVEEIGERPLPGNVLRLDLSIWESQNHLDFKMWPNKRVLRPVPRFWRVGGRT